MSQKNKLKTALIFIGDIVIFYIALAITVFIRYGQKEFDSYFNQHFLPFTSILFIWLLVFFIADFYQLRKIAGGIKFSVTAIKIIIFNFLITVIFFYFIPYFGIAPKRNLILFLAIFTPVFFGWRYLSQKIIMQSGSQELLLIGEDKEYGELIHYLRDHPQLGYRVKNHLRLFDENNINELHSILAEGKIHTIIIPSRLKKNQSLIDYFFQNSHLNANVLDIPSFSEEILKKIPIFSLEESWFLENLLNNRKLLFEKIKRLIDIIIIILLSIPSVILFLLVSLFIKLESNGPILYKQKRIGKNGNIIEIIKFRSMYATNPDGSAESGKAIWADENDPRVTKVGRILRKTRIDEIPQFINIIKGEMSLIGPRPERPEFEKELSEKIPYYNMRHLILPGLTGWAQINYPYGASIEDAKEKLEYDLFYLKNRSAILDIIIALKTARIILSREGR